MTMDSILNGSRPVYEYDSTGTYILPKRKVDSFLSTGEFALEPCKKYDLKISRITQSEWNRILQDAKENGPWERDVYFPPGCQFVDFGGVDMDGKKINSSLLKGRLLVINFWFLSCTPCRREIPELNKLVSGYKNNGVEFVAITPDARKEIINAFPPLNFMYTILPEQKAFIDSIGLSLFPTHVVIDKEGKVITSFVDSGPGAAYWLRRTLDSCLAAH
jgi:thiol-disulfide isomerase/thioredoxin